MRVLDAGARHIRLATSWSRRRPMLEVLVLTVGVALAGALLDGSLGTPQLSGADAVITVRGGAAALAGALAGRLTATDDVVPERLSPRRLAPVRVATVSLVLATGIASFGAAWPSGGLDAARTYLFFATVAMILCYLGGELLAALVLSGYLGACLFVGVPAVGPPRAWAVPMQPTDGLSVGLVLLLAVCALAVGVAACPPRRSEREWRRLSLTRSRAVQHARPVDHTDLSRLHRVQLVLRDPQHGGDAG